MGYQALLFCPDEKTARNVTHVLNDLDFTVEPCSEPFAAVKKLMAQHFDAVVVDCDNEQNATLLFKSARNSSANQSSLAVAVVEGQAGVAKAFRIGANLVLTKPINVEQAKGTLRVARGLLRKGGEAPKAATPAAAPPPAVATQPQAAAPKPVAPAPKPMKPATPVAPAAAVSRPVSVPASPVKHSAPPAMSASAEFAELDELDADSVLDLDDESVEPTVTAPAAEVPAAAPMTAASATGTTKFPWQPSAKMAEPMASALRRAAEAAGQVEPAEPVPAKPVPPPPAVEKRVMSGAMFQAQGHAAAPAPAIEKPVVAPPKIEEPLTVSKTVVREAPAPVAEKPVFDTRDDVAPPTFFPGAYDSDESEGGGKTKALVIVAAVVLLACSAGYLSWKNMGSKNAAASTSASTTSTAATATPSGETTNSRDNAGPAQPTTEEITLGNSAPAAPKSATKPSATKEVAPKEVASKEPAPEPEPEVTQRLIVRNDTRHLEPAAKPQDAEAVQAPSAIGMGGEADTKALANISSAPVNVPKPAAQILRVSQGVMEGLVLKRVQPRYPTQAMQLHIQGSVQLQATISKTGDIENLKVMSGDAILARAAQDAVKQWKYKPYYLNGDPVPIQTQILVNFKLPN